MHQLSRQAESGGGGADAARVLAGLVVAVLGGGREHRERLELRLLEPRGGELVVGHVLHLSVEL